MKKFIKRLACAVVSAALLVTAFPAVKARAEEEKFALNAEKRYLYVNAEARYPEATYNKSVFDFDFAKHPANYLADYKFKWYSQNKKIATVKAGGIVTAAAPGTTKIYCDITSKVTGEKVATVSATVIVRKNASEVKVTNASKYTGKTYSSGDKIDLNRTMYDEKGTAASNRTGGVVTDYTKWTYEPYDGALKVNQSNGVYTITDKASGKYELYCYTYQSDAHNEPIVKSNRVSITVSTGKKPAATPTPKPTPKATPTPKPTAKLTPTPKPAIVVKCETALPTEVGYYTSSGSKTYSRSRITDYTYTYDEKYKNLVITFTGQNLEWDGDSRYENISVSLFDSEGYLVQTKDAYRSITQANVKFKDMSVTFREIEKGNYTFTINNNGTPPKAEDEETASNVELPELPQKISYYSGSTLQSTAQVTKITAKIEGSNLYLYFSGSKTYDSRGNGQSDSCKIGWKLYEIDEVEGDIVVDAGTARTLSIKVGERFKDTKNTAYGCIEKGKRYRLEISNVN